MHSRLVDVRAFDNALANCRGGCVSRKSFASVERSPASNPKSKICNLSLSLSAKSHVIIKIEQVEPGLYVFAGRVKLFHPVGEHFQCFHVAIRPALGKVSAPLLDLPWTPLVRRVLLYPGQHLSVAFTRSKLGL